MPFMTRRPNKSPGRVFKSILLASLLLLKCLLPLYFCLHIIFKSFGLPSARRAIFWFIPHVSLLGDQCTFNHMREDFDERLLNSALILSQQHIFISNCHTHTHTHTHTHPFTCTCLGLFLGVKVAHSHALPEAVEFHCYMYFLSHQ